jgi:hypothetical protein
VTAVTEMIPPMAGPNRQQAALDTISEAIPTPCENRPGELVGQLTLGRPSTALSRRLAGAELA